MNRILPVGAAVLAAAGMGAVLVRAQAASGNVKTQVVQRLRPRAAQAALAARRARAVTYTMLIEEIALVDGDADGELTRGDIVTANGAMADRAGNIVGTWEGTLTDSSPDNLFLNLTYRFAGKGAVIVVGAPYGDGVEGGLPIAPIAGVTGRLRFRGGAALGVDPKDNLTITLLR